MLRTSQEVVATRRGVPDIGSLRKSKWYGGGGLLSPARCHPASPRLWRTGRFQGRSASRSRLGGCDVNISGPTRQSGFYQRTRFRGLAGVDEGKFTAAAHPPSRKSTSACAECATARQVGGRGTAGKGRIAAARAELRSLSECCISGARIAAEPPRQTWNRPPVFLSGIEPGARFLGGKRRMFARAYRLVRPGRGRRGWNN